MVVFPSSLHVATPEVSDEVIVGGGDSNCKRKMEDDADEERSAKNPRSASPDFTGLKVHVAVLPRQAYTVGMMDQTPMWSHSLPSSISVCMHTSYS